MISDSENMLPESDPHNTLARQWRSEQSPPWLADLQSRAHETTNPKTSAHLHQLSGPKMSSFEP